MQYCILRVQVAFIKGAAMFCIRVVRDGLGHNLRQLTYSAPFSYHSWRLHVEKRLSSSYHASSCLVSNSPFFCSFIVKYIKEMSAFFKSSGSPGANLPWDSPPSTPQRGTEVSPTEVKEPRSIPVKMCQVSRKQCPPDTENRYHHVKRPTLFMFNSVNISHRITDKLQNGFERLFKKGFFYILLWYSL